MYRYKLYAVLVKIEPTSGTDAVPDPAIDAVRCTNVPTLQIGFLETGSRSDAQTGTLGEPDDAPATGRNAKVDVTVELKGAGVAYNNTTGKPECDALLRMCGLGRTVTTTAGSESIDYTTLDSNMETATVYCYTSGGKLIKLVGAVANMKWDLQAAMRGKLTFSIVGKVASDPTEAGLPGTLAFSTVIPPTFASQTCMIGAWSSAAGSDPLVLRKVSGDLGNKTTDLPSAGATDGLAGYAVADRTVSQSMEFQTGALTSLDPFALAKAAGSAKPLTSYQVGGVQYNKCLINTGRWQVGAPKPGNANQIATMSLSGKFSQGSEANSGREIRFRFN